jgi:hypothetical protein
MGDLDARAGGAPESTWSVEPALYAGRGGFDSHSAYRSSVSWATGRPPVRKTGALWHTWFETRDTHYLPS